MRIMQYSIDFISKRQMRKKIRDHILNDLGTIAGVHRYPYPTLFVAGLPKSGTTWLVKILLQLPGYNLRRIYDPRGVTKKHDVDEKVFSTLPHRGYNIVKLHTRYTPENFRIITRYVPRFIVMYRDLRDMCVSRYFHVKSDQSHRHYRLYNEVTESEGIMHSIGIVEELYIDWVRDWLETARRHPESIYLLRYEDLNGNTKETLRRLSDSFHLNMTERQLDDAVASKIKVEKDINQTKGHVQTSYLLDTARSGKIGEWRRYFGEDHIQRFKEVAGQLLIASGFEDDMEWGIACADQEFDET